MSDPLASPPARVASLVPAATEIVVAIGGENLLVGISHECDYPATVTSLPRLTTTPIDPAAPGQAIDAQVRALFASGRPVIAVNGPLLQALHPTVIVTQSLCEVCAVSPNGISPISSGAASGAPVVPMTGRTVAGVTADFQAIGDAIGRAEPARRVVQGLEARLRAIAARADRPVKRMLVIEWLEPLFLAGHWVPELVMAAGGRPLGPEPGAHSIEWSWEAVLGLRPEVVVLALCGMNLERALLEWKRFSDRNEPEASALVQLGVPIWAVDGNAYTSRPGPRLVEAAELFHAAIIGSRDDRLAPVAESGAPSGSR